MTSCTISSGSSNNCGPLSYTPTDMFPPDIYKHNKSPAVSTHMLEIINV